MSFVALNGINVPIASASIEPEEIGHRERAINGAMLVSRRQVLRRYRLTTIPLVRLQATALRVLVLGLHQKWPFNAFELYSSKGVPPVSYTGGVVTSATTPRFGTKKLSVPSGGSIVFPCAAPLAVWSSSAAISWSYWREATAGSNTWLHYVHTYDGTTQRKWVSGARNDAAATAWTTRSGDTVTLTGDGAVRCYDDVVLYPCRIPDEWVPSLYSVSYSVPHDAPRLWLTGNINSDEVGSSTAVSVVGEMTGEDLVQATFSGGWEPAARRLSFVLSESL